MAEPNISIWQSDLVNPTPVERRGDRTTEPTEMAGYWRVEGARTKWDTPVVIWTPTPKDGEPSATTFQIGAKRMNTATHPQEWDQFCATTWLKCIAVRKADWSSALDTGFWPDGKPSRAQEPEKLGVGTEQSGGNNAPIEEVLADEVKALAEKIDETPEPSSQDAANALSGLLDRMRTLVKKAKEAREIAYRPHKEAADAVSNQWAAVIDPGIEAGTKGEAKRKAFLTKEQKRLDAEAAAENERLRKEAEAKRIQDEHDAKSKGVELPPAEAPQQVEAKRATSGTAFGRKTGLKKTIVGEITDLPMFVTQFLFLEGGPDADALAYFQGRADKAAKAGVFVKGMEPKEILV